LRLRLDPIAWLTWAAIFYAALLVTRLMPGLGDAATLLAIPIGLAIAIVGQIAIRLGLGMVRWPPPVEVPPPPASEAGSVSWAREPPILYPVLAEARGQCGWAEVVFRVDRQGRPSHAKILAQAPARIFERSVFAALAQGRLSVAVAAETPARTVIVFVTPGPAAPDWAVQRLEAKAKAGS